MSPREEAALALLRRVVDAWHEDETGQIDGSLIDEAEGLLGIEPQPEPLAPETPITDLELSRRSETTLLAGGIKTVGQLCAMTAADLLRQRSFGPSSLHEVEAILAAHELSLAGGTP